MVSALVLEAILVRMGDLKHKWRLNFTAHIRDGPRAAFGKLIDLATADFSAAPVDTFAAPGVGFVTTGGLVSTRFSTLMDLEVVSFESVLVPAEAGDANAVKKAVAELIKVEYLSQQSASQVLNVPSPPRTDDDKPFVFDHGLISSGIAGNATTVLLVVRL